jgi:hypothetical protein
MHLGQSPHSFSTSRNQYRLGSSILSSLPHIPLRPNAPLGINPAHSASPPLYYPFPSMRIGGEGGVILWPPTCNSSGNPDPHSRSGTEKGTCFTKCFSKNLPLPRDFLFLIQAIFPGNRRTVRSQAFRGIVEIRGSEVSLRESCLHGTVDRRRVVVLNAWESRLRPPALRAIPSKVPPQCRRSIGLM